MQAAALGVYLLYEPNGDYLTDEGTGALQGSATPSGASEWRVTGSAARGFTITNLATAAHRPVRFVPASGCATYPEAQVDATGAAFTGASPEAAVLGTVEGHAHVTAFEFLGGDWHCGAAVEPVRRPVRAARQLRGGRAGEQRAGRGLRRLGRRSRGPSDMHGWPTFVDWPSPTALAEEGDYYTGIERAWKAGLRLMVTNLVDNEALCSLMTTRHNPCNDMAAVQIQNRDLHALQDYIDAQSGGPGKGWFRIVTDPFQARQVINEGKLAVIEGIEVSRLFGCGEYNGVPQCNQAQVDAGLKQVRRMGVRTFFPVHEFNNAFGGTKMIAGATGELINAGNRLETGSFWTLQPCSAQDQDAEQTTTPAGDPIAQLLNGPVSSMLGGNPLPVYGSGPQCNTQGLTSLGAYLIHQMIKQHVIIQLDHMDSKTATAALAIAQAATTRASSPPTAARRPSCSSGSTRRAGSSPRRSSPRRRSSAPGSRTWPSATRSIASASGGARTRTGSAISLGRRARRSATRSSPTTAGSRSPASSGASAGSTSTPTGSRTTACTPTGCTSSSSSAAGR